MARLTNDQMRNMTDNQKIDYAEIHPAEAGRLARISSETVVQCTKVHLEHQASELSSALKGLFNNSCIE